MKILLDHNAPHGLRNALADHEVHTAPTGAGADSKTETCSRQPPVTTMTSS